MSNCDDMTGHAGYGITIIRRSTHAFKILFYTKLRFTASGVICPWSSGPRDPGALVSKAFGKQNQGGDPRRVL